MINKLLRVGILDIKTSGGENKMMTELLERIIEDEAPETDYIEAFFAGMSDCAEIIDSVKTLIDEAIIPTYLTNYETKKNNQGSFAEYLKIDFTPAEIYIADEKIAW